jgi:hypothetical protein
VEGDPVVGAGGEALVVGHQHQGDVFGGVQLQRSSTISRPVFSSRLPVGSSERTTEGLLKRARRWRRAAARRR